MNAPKTRGQAINMMCKSCIYDPHPDAHGTWREQVGACGSVDCPLWCFRPLPANAPDWLLKRDPDQLPGGFITPDTDKVLALIRNGEPATCTGHLNGGSARPGTLPARPHRAGVDTPENAGFEGCES